MSFEFSASLTLTDAAVAMVSTCSSVEPYLNPECSDLRARRGLPAFGSGGARHNEPVLVAIFLEQVWGVYLGRGVP
jgi:hypothetical protein